MVINFLNEASFECDARKSSFVLQRVIEKIGTASAPNILSLLSIEFWIPCLKINTSYVPALFLWFSLWFWEQLLCFWSIRSRRTPLKTEVQFGGTQTHAPRNVGLSAYLQKMTNSQKRLDELEDEAAITEMIGNLAGNVKTRMDNRERARKFRQLANEEKRQRAQK